MWQNRERALSFGSDAARYDHTRPGYPDDLVDELMAGHPWNVLDVGCGTGKAGRLLVARGCDVLGVEPDDRMAAVARAQGLDVEIAAFEQWDAAGRRFDLAICAQAWHWIEPTAGLRCVAQALDAGARFCVFWNRTTYDEDVQAALDAVYRRLAPSIADRGAIVGVVPDDRLGQDLRAMEASPHFRPPQEHRYRWSHDYSVDDFASLLRTHSDHKRLPEATFAALLDGIGALMQARGGQLTVHYHTRMLTLTRS